MQEFFLKHKKRIIGAGIAILVLVTVIASGIKLNATLLESAIGVVVTPFQDLTTGISSWIDDTVTSARNKTKLKDENEELKQQIAELTNKNRKLSMYETENERLTALLKIAQKYPTYDSVGARVIAKDPGIWYDGFTINKGTTSSISATKVSELSEVEGVEDSSSEEVSDTADDSSSEGVEAAFTVTVQVASTSPFFTVIVTSPALSAVTSPSLTVAMVSSELVQTRVLSVTFSGESVAASVSFPPTSSSAVVLSSVIPVARTAICSLSP